jgi:hypothetical protein
VQKNGRFLELGCAGAALQYPKGGLNHAYTLDRITKNCHHPCCRE